MTIPIRLSLKTSEDNIPLHFLFSNFFFFEIQQPVAAVACVLRSVPHNLKTALHLQTGLWLVNPDLCLREIEFEWSDPSPISRRPLAVDFGTGL